MYYFEDFRVGDAFDLGNITVTEEEIVTCPVLLMGVRTPSPPRFLMVDM